MNLVPVSISVHLGLTYDRRHGIGNGVDMLRVAVVLRILRTDGQHGLVAADGSVGSFRLIRSTNR